MPYHQQSPTLDNQFAEDRVLRSYLERVLPEDVLEDVRPRLNTLGEDVAGKLYEMQQSHRTAEPVLTRWSPWGERIDHVSVTPLWREAERLAAEYGLVAEAYEQNYGASSRIYQFALAYLFIPSTDMYGCPLAMTDGAARTLLEAGNQALIEAAVPHLTSRAPTTFWTSGQWMTELPGGSDVSKTETAARQEDGVWRLYGRKWFTSAVNAQMALALARPVGQSLARQTENGSDELALFYIKLRDENDRLQNIRVNRLKDKFGTRKLPTAELALDGAPAVPVQGLEHGTRLMAPMLSITRTWNAVTAAAYMRRGIALARDYASKREAFGSLLKDKPLHADTLNGLQAEFEGAFHLALRLAELLGRKETGDDTIEPLLRLLTPLAKLTTARQCVTVCSEVLEAFGGAGYIEDTGIPTLLRDAQVLTIWEGTTNVLALDFLRSVSAYDDLASLQQEIERCLVNVNAPELQIPAQTVRRAFSHTREWLEQNQEMNDRQADARRLALTLGRALELALLVNHAQWSLSEKQNAQPAAAAQRLAFNNTATLPITPGNQ